MEDLIRPFDQLNDPALVAQLHDAVHQLTLRSLVQSASWAAELLTALPSLSGSDTEQSSTSTPAPAPATTDLSERQTPSATFTLARSFMDTRQYRRAAHTLRHERGKLPQFLRLYALYLAGERRREEERMELADWTEPSNDELPALLNELQRSRKAGDMDAFLWYLLGVVLKRLNQRNEAIDALVQSLRLFPLNQGAWLELAPLCETRRIAERLPVGEPHFMRSIFIGGLLNDTEGSTQAREIFEAFAAAVPTCRLAKIQLAVSMYHMRLFDEAQQLFAAIYAADEFCLEGVDIYSNILYVKEDKVALSILANKCMRVDKFRLETCCVIGNYYSMRGQHEQALSYFQRALRINRNYLSAWTLMGHEFLEMTNTAAAVEAYRRAVDINPNDFRAWYGLGQTYELLNMPMYTLYYYQKAAALRPRDARMWCAIAHIFQQLKKWDQAARCFERAVGCNDREGIALSKLAALYQKMARESQRDGQTQEQTEMYLDKAALYHEANLERSDEEDKLQGQHAVDALRFLAEHFFNKGDVVKARDYAKRLVDCPGHDKDFVKTLLRQIYHREKRQ